MQSANSKIPAQQKRWLDVALEYPSKEGGIMCYVAIKLFCVCVCAEGREGSVKILARAVIRKLVDSNARPKEPEHELQKPA